MLTHVATIHWERSDAPFLDRRYSRVHRWSFDGDVDVVASASPHIVPLPLSSESAVDPEEAFVASLASCHMLVFLDLAARAGYVVDRYTDEAVGQMGRTAGGGLWIEVVTLRPQVSFVGARRPSTQEHLDLHHAAHAGCFLANSVKTEVRCEPVLTQV